MDKFTVPRRCVAKRWGMHPQALARWRRKDEGPKFVKAQHPIRILYPIIEVVEYGNCEPLS